MTVPAPASASCVVAVAVSRPTTPSGVPRLGLDLLRRRQLGRFDHDLEFEPHVGDAGFQHGVETAGVDLLEILHASMQEAKNGASLSALNTASRGAATVISPAIYKSDSLRHLKIDEARADGGLHDNKVRENAPRFTPAAAAH